MLLDTSRLPERLSLPLALTAYLMPVGSRRPPAGQRSTAATLAWWLNQYVLLLPTAGTHWHGAREQEQDQGGGGLQLHRLVLYALTGPPTLTRAPPAGEQGPIYQHGREVWRRAQV
jgi:hypothetical protein